MERLTGGIDFPPEVDELIERSRATFQPRYIPPEVVEQVEAAGFWIHGVRYFNGLFDEEAPTAKKLESIFVGATAHGAFDLAQEAQDMLLTFTDYGKEVTETLISVLGKAHSMEWGAENWPHAKRLRAKQQKLERSLKPRKKRRSLIRGLGRIGSGS